MLANQPFLSLMDSTVTPKPCSTFLQLSWDSDRPSNRALHYHSMQLILQVFKGKCTFYCPSNFYVRRAEVPKVRTHEIIVLAVAFFFWSQSNLDHDP